MGSPVENVSFFMLAAGLLYLTAALVAGRWGFAPVAALGVCFGLLFVFSALAWRLGDDAPGAGIGAFIFGTISLVLVAGGLLGVAVGRWRRAGETRT